MNSPTVYKTMASSKTLIGTYVGSETCTTGFPDKATAIQFVKKRWKIDWVETARYQILAILSHLRGLDHATNQRLAILPLESLVEIASRIAAIIEIGTAISTMTVELNAAIDTILAQVPRVICNTVEIWRRGYWMDPTCVIRTLVDVDGKWRAYEYRANAVFSKTVLDDVPAIMQSYAVAKLAAKVVNRLLIVDVIDLVNSFLYADPITAGCAAIEKRGIPMIISDNRIVWADMTTYHKDPTLGYGYFCERDGCHYEKYRG